jgi:hypothetical protein
MREFSKLFDNLTEQSVISEDVRRSEVLQVLTSKCRSWMLKRMAELGLMSRYSQVKAGVGC